MRALAIITAIITLSFAALPQSWAAPNYKREMKRATRRGQLYNVQTWDAKIIWYATFFNDQFRREFAKKHATVHHMGPLESAQWMADQHFIHNRQWDFVVIIYTKKEFKRLSMDPDSFWEIFLTTGSGETVHPNAIEQIPVSPYEKIMYQHINRWSKLYRVAFPKVDLGDKIELTLQSVVGQSTVEWKIKK